MEYKNTICAVVVTYNPDDLLLKLITSIKNQVAEIVIVDNNTQDKNSKEILKNFENNKNITIIYNSVNYGIATALNQGIRYFLPKRYKWILTCDQDSEFIDGTYELILNDYEQMSDKNNIMLLAPTYSSNLNKDTKLLPKKIQWDNAVCVITSGSLFKIDIFDKIGSFDDKLFIDQVDFDFCYRILEAGYKIKSAINVNFIHYLGNSKKKLFWTVTNHSAIRRFYGARNSVYMLKKHFKYFPKETRIHCLYFTLKVSVLIILFEKNKIRKIVSIFKGIYAGLFKLKINFEAIK